MTWDAYNRRKPVLREVLALADRRRDLTVDDVFTTVPEAREVFDDATDLLLDVQLLWFQRLNGQMELQLTEGDDTSEMTAIAAWISAAEAMPGARALLDASAHRPELAKAFGLERAFLAEASGVPGQRIVEAARSAASDVPVERESRPQGFMTRLRGALAA
jgi:hypothetical protein